MNPECMTSHPPFLGNTMCKAMQRLPGSTPRSTMGHPAQANGHLSQPGQTMLINTRVTHQNALFEELRPILAFVGWSQNIHFFSLFMTVIPSFLLP